MFDPFSPEHRQPRFGLWEFFLGVIVGASLVGAIAYFTVLVQSRRQFEMALMERERAEVAQAQAQAALSQVKTQPIAPTDADITRVGDNLVDDICNWRWREIYFRGAPEFAPKESPEEFADRMNKLTLPRMTPHQRPTRQKFTQVLNNTTAAYHATATPRTGAMPIHVNVTFVLIDGEWLIRDLDVTQEQ